MILSSEGDTWVELVVVVVVVVAVTVVVVVDDDDNFDSYMNMDRGYHIESVVVEIVEIVVVVDS